MRATTQYRDLLLRILKENVTTVTVTERNLKDLLEIYTDGLGRGMGIKEPTIGGEMEVRKLLEMVENANNNY
jgi:hypothetical protein